MTFTGPALPLTRDDVRAAAERLDVPEPVIWALRRVESAGKAFKDARPIIACEPHVFYRELPVGQRRRAVAAGLAHPKWGVLPYLSGQDARYDQLKRACAIDRAAALRSASWGAYQCMGFNAARCGFASVEAFVAAHCESEGAQLRAIAEFIAADAKMLAALQDGDWKAFAYRYNGPGHARNSYVDKFARAVAHFQGKRMEAEAERVAKQPDDPAGAKQAAKDTARDAVGFGVYLTALWSALGEARAALDEAIEKLVGIQGMAPWVTDTILVLTAVSAALIIVNGVRAALRARENKAVTAGEAS